MKKGFRAASKEDNIVYVQIWLYITCISETSETTFWTAERITAISGSWRVSLLRISATWVYRQNRTQSPPSSRRQARSACALTTSAKGSLICLLRFVAECAGLAYSELFNVCRRP